MTEHTSNNNQQRADRAPERSVTNLEDTAGRAWGSAVAGGTVQAALVIGLETAVGRPSSPSPLIANNNAAGSPGETGSLTEGRTDMITLQERTFAAELTPQQAEAVIAAARHAIDHDTELRADLESSLGALYQAYAPMNAGVELTQPQVAALIAAVRHAIEHDTPLRPLLDQSLAALYSTNSVITLA